MDSKRLIPEISPRLLATTTKPAELGLNGKFQPKSLFCRCSEFIVHNLCSVDSFKRFPETIAEKLFTDATNFGYFNLNDGNSIKRLQLFVDAYHVVMLSEANCHGLSVLFCENSWTHLKLLLGSNLTKLDVSNCNLGDKHELFRLFQHFSNMITLNLANNRITSDAIRFLTMKVRMLHSGPTKLKHINISGNFFMTSDAVTFIWKAFPQLECLDFSRTLIQSSDCSIFVQNGFSLVDKKCEHFEGIETTGWAKSLIQSWQLFLANNESVLKFYGKLGKTLIKESHLENDSLLVLHKLTDKTVVLGPEIRTHVKTDLKHEDNEICIDKNLLSFYS